MKIELAEAFHVKMPLKFAFETSYGRQTHREVVLVRLISDGLSGWGEAAVSEYPDYSYETPAVAMLVMERYLFPEVVGRDFKDPESLVSALSKVTGYPFSRTGVETAFLDLYCRSLGTPLYIWLGGSRTEIPSGISLGMERDQGVLFDRIRWALDAGYKRIKLKIKPGRDVSIVEAVREHFGFFDLMVDANSSYTLGDADRLLALDGFDLMMIEQPLAADDLVDHAQLQKRLRTHVCLDESIKSPASLRSAAALGSCRVVNIKYGRVGGMLTARAMAKESVAQGMLVWCGGMLETGIGRAHNLALNSLSEFSLPGDISGSDRYWEEDIISPPVRMNGGVIEIIDQPGIGHEVLEDRVRSLAEATILQSS